MKKKLRAVVTIVQEYMADSRYYGNVDFAEDMIKIDKLNFKEDMILFIDDMIEMGGETKIEITEVKDESESSKKTAKSGGEPRQ